MFNKIFFSLLAFVVSFAHITAMDTNRFRVLIDAEGKPTSELQEVLNILGIAHDNSLESIVRATQKQWLQLGKERWQFEERFLDKKDQIMPLLEKMHCIEEIKAIDQHYDYALVLGAYIPRMQSRLSFLLSEWKRGVRFDKIVFLTGERILDKNAEVFPDEISTEREAMQKIYQEMDIPEDLRKVPIVIIDAPQQMTAQGLKRPTTKDTITEWLKTAPSPGKCLAISNQPLIGYQDAVLKTEFPKEFEIETVGPENNECQLFAFHLDNLARWLYQELRYKNKR